MKFFTYGNLRSHQKMQTVSWLKGLDPAIKRMIIMRINLSVCFVVMCIINVYAKNATAQGISLKYKNESIINVIDAIKKQSGYQFLYNYKSLNKAKKVTIEVKAKSLQQTLELLFSNQPFTFEIVQKTIVIKEKENTDEKNPQQTNIDVRGLVVDQDSKPMIGATVKVKGAANGVLTNQQGEFYLNSVTEGSIIQVIYIGYAMQELTARKELGTIQMQEAVGELSQIDVTVSTGYQNLPKERATGAFTQIDNKTLNRNVGINILDRLEGVTSGLLLNRNLRGANNSKISVRGRSTIFATPDPLIILDGFQYEGNIDQINPADVENITILKDAAAASIWGTKAGNGVIVITSKTGKQNQPLQINLTTTLSVAGKPNLYYQPQISSSDYIDLENFLFNKGYYDGELTTTYTPISPAVELFNKYSKNQITDQELTTQLNKLRSHDIRSDLEKYYYRPAINQQYQLNVNGGSKNNWYYLSAGYDKNIANTLTDKYDRITLNAKNTYALLDGRLKLSGDLTFSTGNTYNKPDSYTPYTPYDRIADENGNPLSVTTFNTLRDSYTDNVGDGKLLDWKFRPKDEFISNNRNENNLTKTIATLDFEIMKGLKLIGSFQYLNEIIENDQIRPLSSFYTRNQINTYTTISNNTVKRPIEIGDIRDYAIAKNKSKIGRIQLNYAKTLGENHEINAIAGFEAGDNRLNTTFMTFYGYDAETGTNKNDNINPLIEYPLYYEPIYGARISTAPSSTGQTNILQSLYSNASYSFKKRYIISGSVRQDKSNLFGVRTNQKAVPLWSSGLAWIVNNEDFYNVNWLTFLKLRATYGYSGNVDKSVSGLLTSSTFGLLNDWGSLYSTISNPPNPDLRWEKVKTWNLGLDFALINNIITGSVDYYKKSAFDLIGNSEIALQSGINTFRGNNANLQTSGIDLLLSSKNLQGKLSWSTDLLLNYNTDKVTKYLMKQSSNLRIVSRNFENPLEGYPYNAIYSFPSAGLNTLGSPQGYLNGQLSSDYTKLLNQLDPNQLIYHGSASPKYFGSLINTFNYRHFELSINITYKFDYFFKRLNVFDGNVSNSYSALSLYEKRWQTPGDELNTKIPAASYPIDYNSATFFSNSFDLVESADHIRLQDIRLTYHLPKTKVSHLPFNSLSAFAYLKNAGVIWRKNKLNIDPDFGTTNIPLPLNFSVGLNLTF